MEPERRNRISNIFDGLTGLVTELVEGPTLADRLERGPLPIPQALAIGRQIAEAIGAAHEKGIVHRDLKPDNVVLQPTSSSDAVRAKVLDFGLAKALSVPNVLPSSTVQSTENGQILGTPAYMSPEQARGQAVDKRTDIWAFGCVLFERLTGRRAFAGSTMSDTFVRILEHEPDWTVLPAGTPASVRMLLERCLRKDPGKRLHDIADARIELEESAAAGRRGRVRWSRSAILTSIVVGLLSVIGLWVWRSVPRPAQQSPSLSRLTFEEGSQTDPTFSPDGSLIAFASSKSGNFDIWMRPVGGGNAVQVADDPANDTQPDWSPKTNQLSSGPSAMAVDCVVTDSRALADLWLPRLAPRQSTSLFPRGTTDRRLCRSVRNR
jgi:serine/threonine protein kinase